jgi:hypothetical protein
MPKPKQSKKRFIAKKAAHMVVALNVARKVKEQVLTHSELESDSITLTICCMIVGETVALHTDPYTDVAVDKSANWLQKKLPKKKSKQDPVDLKKDHHSKPSE